MAISQGLLLAILAVAIFIVILVMAGTLFTRWNAANRRASAARPIPLERRTSINTSSWPLPPRTSPRPPPPPWMRVARWTPEEETRKWATGYLKKRRPGLSEVLALGYGEPVEGVEGEGESGGQAAMETDVMGWRQPVALTTRLPSPVRRTRAARRAANSPAALEAQQLMHVTLLIALPTPPSPPARTRLLTSYPLSSSTSTSSFSHDASTFEPPEVSDLPELELGTTTLRLDAPFASLGIPHDWARASLHASTKKAKREEALLIATAARGPPPTSGTRHRPRPRPGGPATAATASASASASATTQTQVGGTPPTRWAPREPPPQPPVQGTGLRTRFQ